MRLLVACYPPTILRDPTPFEGMEGNYVLPRWTRGYGWHYSAVFTGLCCGRYAKLEWSELDCMILATAFSKSIDDPDIAAIAATAWQNLAWLQDVSLGMNVILSSTGKLRVDYRSASVEQIRKSEGEWCAQQRAEGWLPCCALTRVGWKLVAIPSPHQLVDVDELLERVKQMEGYKSTSVVVPL